MARALLIGQELIHESLRTISNVSEAGAAGAELLLPR
jgi:hypothetical protein